MTVRPEVLERVSDRASARHDAIVLRLVRLLLGLWRPFDGWYDGDLVTARSARSASLVEAASAQTFLLAREYVRQLEMLDGRPAPALTRAEPTYPRTNTTALDVYTRPAEQYRYAASQGETPEAALEAATERVEKTATMDLAASRRDGYDDALRAAGRTTYRRVLHPERSKGGACGLCVAASTNVYTVGELLPIHDGCNCGVAASAPGADPADVLNGIDLKALYALAGSTGADDLANVRYRVDEHGELGPVLHRDGDRESAAHRRNRRAKAQPIEPGPQQWAAELDTLQRSLERLAARAAAGADVATPLQWQQDRVAQLTRRLAAAAA